MNESTSMKRASVVLFLLVCLLIPLAFKQGGTGVKAAIQAVGWGNVEVRYVSANTNVYPDIKYDGNGRSHVAWVEYGATDADGARLLYTNNVSGAWLTPYEVTGSVARGTDPLHSMTLESNRVHFVYVANSGFAAHRYLTVNGSDITKSSVTTLSTTKASTPELLTDSSGKVHAFWGDRRASSLPQVVHRIWSGGAWEANTGRLIRNDGNNQRYIGATQTSDGVIHVAFSGDSSVRYATFNGTTWTAGSDLASGKIKQVSLTSKGNTVAALYSIDSSGRKMYYHIGYGTSWSNRVLVSSGSSFDEFPEIIYSPTADRIYALWMSGVDEKNLYIVNREIIVGGAIANLQTATSSKAERKWTRAAVQGTTIGVIWQDKAIGRYDIRQITGNTSGVTPATSTPTLSPTPTLPPVGFTVARSSASPSSNPSVTLALSNLTGNPDQMRVSTSAFTAQAASPAWEGLNTSKTVNTGSGVNSCATTVYVQLRNSSNGGISSVQTISAVIDSSLQSAPQIYTMETAPSARPASLTQVQVQPFAPDRVSEKYTRNMTFAYTIAQETSGCSGVTRHKAGPFVVNGSSYPYSGFSAFDSFVTGNDSSGTGFEEQTVNATVILTDTLGNQSLVSKQFTYDDDAPVLTAGGSITLPNGASTSVSVIPLDFTAVVTDDGFMNTAPADKRYWGVWVVATTNSNFPTPQDFLQYGDVIGLEDGATHVDYVRLVNALTGTESGTRHVHMRFLDGAGNYTETGLTSPAISLQPNYSGLPNYLPLIYKYQ
ncbi:hypothetical protein [Herpetosiphon gulosus]|uniref:Uncharacterized protein n=1 Tax=Herpetosiphon gulosus TaxID=1973496 RepID=A0ABP9X681_9CHLR